MVVGLGQHAAEAVTVDTAALLCVTGADCDGSEPCRPVCFPPPVDLLPPFED